MFEVGDIVKWKDTNEDIFGVIAQIKKDMHVPGGCDGKYYDLYYIDWFDPSATWREHDSHTIQKV
jgi:hypothetical protein